MQIRNGTFSIVFLFTFFSMKKVGKICSDSLQKDALKEKLSDKSEYSFETNAVIRGRIKQEVSFLYQDMTLLKIAEIEQTTVNIV